jgi:hypothetical protein
MLLLAYAKLLLGTTGSVSPVDGLLTRSCSRSRSLRGWSAPMLVAPCDSASPNAVSRVSSENGT